ncbi:hypothetical protein O9992_23140 [Vibrio lentus]|nr:hypothetical protein [Vibrio lentus]
MSSESWKKLQQCFSLVDAHYQTSPNDLMQFLNNPAIHLYAAWQQDICLGWGKLVTEEGGLDKRFDCSDSNWKK